MANYPGSLPSLGTKTDNVDNVMAADYNNIAGEVTAVATELGTDVAGSKTDLKTRLAVAIADNGVLEFADSSILTISSGAITVTQNFHRIATEGGAASDDLDTINGLANDGTVLFLRPSTSNDVVLIDGDGNIECSGGADITLDDTDSWAVLIYDGNLSAWLAGKISSGQSLTTSLGAANSYIAVYTTTDNIEGTDDLQWDGTTFTIGDSTAGRDYVITVDGETNNGVITWMEDEDYFRFSDDILMLNQEAIYFDSIDTYVKSNTDDPEDLLIGADQDIIMEPDNQVIIAAGVAEALVIGNGGAGLDYQIKMDGEDNDGILTWMEDEDNFKFEDDVTMGGDATPLTIGVGAAGVDYILTFDGEDNDGILTWMEDEDYFQFGDDVVMGGDATPLTIGVGAAGIDYILTFDGETNDGTITWLEDEDFFGFGQGIFVNETANTNMTIGLTINQGANDNQAIALKSSDIAHGVTAVAETDTYGELLKVSGDSGGVWFRGYTEDESGVIVDGFATNDNTDKTTSAGGNIILTARLKNGTAFTDHGADANLVVIRNNATARYIFDAEGSAHADVEWTTFDDYDDIELLNALEASLGNDILKDEFGEFLQENKEILQANKLVKYGDNGHNFINTTRMHMLEVGAIRQLAERINKLERQIVL